MKEEGVANDNGGGCFCCGCGCLIGVAITLLVTTVGGYFARG